MVSVRRGRLAKMEIDLNPHQEASIDTLAGSKTSIINFLTSDASSSSMAMSLAMQALLPCQCLVARGEPAAVERVLSPGIARNRTKQERSKFVFSRKTHPMEASRPGVDVWRSPEWMYGVCRRRWLSESPCAPTVCTPWSSPGPVLTDLLVQG